MVLLRVATFSDWLVPVLLAQDAVGIDEAPQLNATPEVPPIPPVSLVGSDLSGGCVLHHLRGGRWPLLSIYVNIHGNGYIHGAVPPPSKRAKRRCAPRR